MPNMWVHIVIILVDAAKNEKKGELFVQRSNQPSHSDKGNMTQEESLQYSTRKEEQNFKNVTYLTNFFCVFVNRPEGEFIDHEGEIVSD